MAIKERLFGKNSVDYAQTLEYIGIVHRKQSKYDKALKNHKESLTIAERLVGKDSLDYAKTLNNIGAVYR